VAARNNEGIVKTAATEGTMSDTFKTVGRGPLWGNDRYLALLAIVLLGYALMGKGFAYLGFPPLYIGEIAFLFGAVAFLRSGALVASLATLPSVILVTLIVWVLARTIPFVGVYGFDSLRDSTVVVYGGFALFVIGLLLEDARRIDTVLRYYKILLTSFPAMFVGFCLTVYWKEYIPSLNGSVPIVDTTTSAVGTHLAGTMVFVLIGYRKVSLPWFLVWLATLTIVASTNRGATLASLGPVVFAILMLGRLRLLATAVLTVVSLFAVLLTVESAFIQDDVAEPLARRGVNAHQIIMNAESMLWDSGDPNVEGTKRWRLRWWEIIIDDTIYGPNFWTGRGFGLNLADADGANGPSGGGAPTRSPHNVNMTLLARAGVPGLVLWSLLLMSWGAMMLHAMLVARARGHKQWADLFLFVICYLTSILINAFVDVTLEGPMQGIWFWCLFGFGIGSVMVYRAQTADGIGSSPR
jgi:hypothetical protein